MVEYGIFFFQAEDGIRDLVRSRGLGDVYKRQVKHWAIFLGDNQYLSKFGRSGKVLKAY